MTIGWGEVTVVRQQRLRGRQAWVALALQWRLQLLLLLLQQIVVPPAPSVVKDWGRCGGPRLVLIVLRRQRLDGQWLLRRLLPRQYLRHLICLLYLIYQEAATAAAA